MLSLLITRKKSVGDQWKQKTAEEAELLLSEEEDEDECYQGKDSQAATAPPSYSSLLGRRKTDNKVEIAQARRDLETCLKIPLTQHSYGGSYPTMSGTFNSDVLMKKEEKAVDVLENNLKFTKNLLRSKKSNQKKKFKNKKQKKSN